VVSLKTPPPSKTPEPPGCELVPVGVQVGDNRGGRVGREFCGRDGRTARVQYLQGLQGSAGSEVGLVGRLEPVDVAVRDLSAAERSTADVLDQPDRAFSIALDTFESTQPECGHPLGLAVHRVSGGIELQTEDAAVGDFDSAMRSS
jgi:hypothetical protein